MTDRHSGYTVILENDVREDDAQPILDAIRMIKGVIDVTPIVHSFEAHAAQIRARSELRSKLFKALRED